MSNTGYLCVTDPMHSIYIFRTLTPMHSDHCREVEGDAHAGYLSMFGPLSKKSKNLDNCNAWKLQQEDCYAAMLDDKFVVGCPTALDA